VFNNGAHGNRSNSSVDEIAVPLDVPSSKSLTGAELLAGIRQVWTYTDPKIRSGHISGAQRLANGNTLICAGESGLLLEVDAKGEVAWEYSNPHFGDQSPGGPPGHGGPAGGPRPNRRPPPDGRDDADGPAGQGSNPDGGLPSRPGRGGRGQGPFGPYGLFRAERYSLDYPGIVKVLEKSKSANESGAHEER
jgi:hypothetical protein